MKQKLNLEVRWNIIICRMKQGLVQIHQQRELTVLQQSNFILSAQHFGTLNNNNIIMYNILSPRIC